MKELPDPVPGPGEVVVTVKAADVNFPDMMVIEGTYQVKPPLPFSPGKAAAGVVELVGESVTTLKPGDRVLACVEYGAYAEKLVARADQCHSMPDEISYAKAAAMGLVYLTAYFALTDRARLQPGESVFVLGAKGGVGVASVQVAKALGFIEVAKNNFPDAFAKGGQKPAPKAANPNKKLAAQSWRPTVGLPH